MDAVLGVGTLADEGEVQTSNEEAFEVDILLEEALVALEVQLGVQAEKYDKIRNFELFDYQRVHCH